jgi:pimeloyl-ACP methyl ester carboxylesterase
MPQRLRENRLFGFLAFCSPDWGKVSIAGHSQGGGLTLYFAKHFPLAGVQQISATQTIVTSFAPAFWGIAMVQPGIAAHGATSFDRCTDTALKDAWLRVRGTGNCASTLKHVKSWLRCVLPVGPGTENAQCR